MTLLSFALLELEESTLKDGPPCPCYVAEHVGCKVPLAHAVQSLIILRTVAP